MLDDANALPQYATKLLPIDAPVTGDVAADFEAWTMGSAQRWSVCDGWTPYPMGKTQIDPAEVGEAQANMLATYERFPAQYAVLQDHSAWHVIHPWAPGGAFSAVCESDHPKRGQSPEPPNPLGGSKPLCPTPCSAVSVDLRGGNRGARTHHVTRLRHRQADLAGFGKRAGCLAARPGLGRLMPLPHGQRLAQTRRGWGERPRVAWPPSARHRWRTGADRDRIRLPGTRWENTPFTLSLIPLLARRFHLVAAHGQVTLLPPLQATQPLPAVAATPARHRLPALISHQRRRPLRMQPIHPSQFLGRGAFQIRADPGRLLMAHTRCSTT